MAFGYVELTLAIEKDDTLIFDIKDADGNPKDLSSYNQGTVTLTDISSGSNGSIGSVEIEPDSVKGRIEVNVDRTKLTSDTFTIPDIDPYGNPPLSFAMAVSLQYNDSGTIKIDTLFVRAKVRLVKVG